MRMSMVMRMRMKDDRDEDDEHYEDEDKDDDDAHGVGNTRPGSETFRPPKDWIAAGMLTVIPVNPVV